jgi:hypothetical protein
MDNIYNRPLFRQMGGTAMPSPQEQMAMQQPMPMSPPMEQPMVSPEQIGEQLAQAEADVGAQGVGIGQELAKRMLEGLDSAETPKDIMDSIRGDDKSVEERRTELAEFVGDEDANQTPETVLAMVQPTIMLTERGAMDSGVGELMEGVADSEMETMEGEPTDVGGGVASLMGVGQQPVQNFRYGGIVQKFNLGGDATGRQLSTAGRNVSPQNQQFYGLNPQGFYEKNLPFFESLFDTQQQRQTAKANLLFDIAKAGAALATGVNPLTGQRQKMNVVETLSSGLGAVADPLKQYGQAVQQAEQQPKMMAAQEAIKQADEQRKFEQDLAKMEKQNLFEFEKQLRDQTFTRQQTVSAQDHQMSLLEKQDALNTTLEKLKNQMRFDNDERLILLKDQLDQRKMELQAEINENKAVADFDRKKEEYGLIQSHELEKLKTQAEIKTALQNDQQAFVSKENELNRQLEEVKIEIDKNYKEGQLQSLELDNDLKKQKLEIESKKFELEKAKYDNFQKMTQKLGVDFESPVDTNDVESLARFGGINVADAFGSFAFLRESANAVSGIFDGTIAPNTKAAVKAVESVNSDFKKTASETNKILGGTGRLSDQQYKDLVSGLPKPKSFRETTFSAAESTKQTINSINTTIDTLNERLRSSPATKENYEEKAKILAAISKLQKFRAIYSNMYGQLTPRKVDGVTQPGQLPDSVRNRSITTTTTDPNTSNDEKVMEELDSIF